MINYIRRDELTHVVLFANILKTLRREFPEIFDAALLEEMFRRAVKEEIAWTDHIIGDDVPGITRATTAQYTRWLANERMRLLNAAPLFPEAVTNPYTHLEAMADNNSEKTNFFESTVVNYTQSSSLQGTWDF
jgi:ribonucleoside-diphosphate reductase beta chain